MPWQRDLTVKIHPRGFPLSRGLKIWVIYLKMGVLIDLLMVYAGWMTLGSCGTGGHTRALKCL